MTSVPNWAIAANNYNVIIEGTNDAVTKDAVVLGSETGIATLHEWDQLQQVFMTGNRGYIGVFDHFTGGELNPTWSTDLATGATATVGGAYGILTLATDTDDNDHATLAYGLNFVPEEGTIFFEARVASVSAITLRAIEIGLSDALSETAGLAFSNHSAGGIVDVAADAILFGYDTDASMTAWAVNISKAGDPFGLALTQTPSTSYQKFNIVISEAGDALMYINNVLVLNRPAAVTPTVPFTPWISLKSLSGAAKSITIDYVFAAAKAKDLWT